MKAVLKCRLLSGLTVDLCAYSFKFTDLNGAEILGGDSYFIDKAIERGAINKVTQAKRKAKSKTTKPA